MILKRQKRGNFQVYKIIKKIKTRIVFERLIIKEVEILLRIL